MYSALDIAKYVVNYGLVRMRPVTNLKLQKLLYFLWLEYFKCCGTYLYEDEICAWKLGPVVPDVYYRYCSYGGAFILKTEEVAIEENDKEILNNILDKYISLSASYLVDKTHAIGTPWNKIYDDGEGNRCTIPFDLIVKLEK